MRFLKDILHDVVGKAGYKLLAKDALMEKNADEMESALKRLKEIGINPGTIIDVGAAEGIWTKKALSVWPFADFHLIEPLSEQEEKLKSLKKTNSNINYHLAVAGEKPGMINMNISEDLDGSGIYGVSTGKVREVPVIAIDTVTGSSKKPVLIKLDTHGYEVAIIKGSINTLKFTDVLVIEVYGFPISPTCLLFHELSSYVDSLGFRTFDIVDVMRRPEDSAFWQADVIYLRKDHPVFQNNSYA
jgi:FkbM family methyltransferase